MSVSVCAPAISKTIWDMKYRLKSPDGQPIDKDVGDTWRRVARHLASAESDPAKWEEAFYEAQKGFKFLPAGRIISGAGAKRNVTLFNCFVMGNIPDDMAGIFDSLKEAALTMQQGGGIGYDFSTLRPKGAPAKGVGADASGPLTFMDVWDAMCRTIMSAGTRRGAMMGVMRCDHPDIEQFIEAKREPGRLRMFNLSVLVTDAFMDAIKEDQSWDLVFNGVIAKSVPARELWAKIMRGTYAYAEPGVIFIDRINARNNLHYCEDIHATNPCGEVPLPPYGACLLASVNLATMITKPFTDDAAIDIDALSQLVTTGVRMMDNTIDVSNFPLDKQHVEAKTKRRIGLGITGLADALIMCGARYGSDTAVTLVEEWLGAIERTAYLASIELAKEKGPFDLYDKEPFLTGENIRKLDRDIQELIAEHGIRNALLTAIAPTGTISLFAGNVSSGLEPVFSFEYSRDVLQPDGSKKEEKVTDHAYALYRRMFGDAELTDAFVTAQDLTPHEHLVMQAAAQKHIDSSISKTVNVHEDLPFEDFSDLYMQAYNMGCKGCSTYRPNDITGSVLKTSDAAKTTEPSLPLESKSKTLVPGSEGESGAVVQMFKPLDRPGELPGKTYKLQWPETEHAMYITINDILDDTGRTRPLEIFINTKNMEHHTWTTALTRMISAVFRRGGDISFIPEELRAIFDPRGGQWLGGKYVPSIIAAIGDVVQRHLIDTGFICTEDNAEEMKLLAAVNDEGTSSGSSMFSQCPKCGQLSVIRQEGCDKCTSGCGYSRCG
ncbi:MAG: adenosylcobalamin-dependent ribonucleoside-diphosphate reductase [Aestuariibacter sp.]|nr:adenosylcobalamin-dependent ribonucleoside-diphosphate reductase [Aestuariibacter sp.]